MHSADACHMGWIEYYCFTALNRISTSIHQRVRALMETIQSDGI